MSRNGRPRPCLANPLRVDLGVQGDLLVDDVLDAGSHLTVTEDEDVGVRCLREVRIDVPEFGTGADVQVDTSEGRVVEAPGLQHVSP
ncbi:hypothetical protein CXF46_04700 [Corynebacterium bovis]|nr:hypothetical protein CXF29_02200 [Corynebacterium bovis]RRQ15960.1 hypothetical protein CXF46_04700 [Corynebacterium bovis]